MKKTCRRCREVFVIEDNEFDHHGRYCDNCVRDDAILIGLTDSEEIAEALAPVYQQKEAYYWYKRRVKGLKMVAYADDKISLIMEEQGGRPDEAT